MIEVLNPSTFTKFLANLLESDIRGIVVKEIILDSIHEVDVINIKWGLG